MKPLLADNLHEMLSLIHLEKFVICWRQGSCFNMYDIYALMTCWNFKEFIIFVDCRDVKTPVDHSQTYPFILPIIFVVLMSCR